MNAVLPVLRLWALAWNRWALSEMGADHPDAPAVVLRINHLERPMS